MRKVIICRGLPASGKSTWSRKWVREHPTYKRINRDDLRMMMYDGMWTKEREKAVLAAREDLICLFLDKGYNIVLDDTNLVPERLAETIQIIEKNCTYYQERTDSYIGTKKHKSNKLKIEIKDFMGVSLETCIERNSLRPDATRVPERFIRDYYNKYVTKLLKDRGTTKWEILY